MNNASNNPDNNNNDMGNNANNSSDQRSSSYREYYLHGWVCITLIGPFYFGYTIGVINPLLVYFSIDIFKWDQKQQELYSGLLGSIVSLGALFGVFFGGELASYMGRRKAFFTSDIIGMIGAIIASIQDISIMLAGRFICGIGVGMYCVLAPIMLSEISPKELKGFIATLNAAMIASGMLIAYVLGYPLPYPYDDNGDNGESYWKFMVLFPVILIAIRDVLGLTVYVNDTPKYLIQIGKDDEAKEVLSKIYDGNESQVTSHYDMLINERNIDKQGVNISFIDLFTRKYRYRTLLGSAYSILQQLAGINVFLTFSTMIFLGNDNTTTQPTLEQYNQATNLTVILGIILAISAFICSFLALKFGRKTLVIVGYGILVLIWILIVIFVQGIIAQISILIYIVVFNLSIGSILWTYCAEILPPIGVSFIGFLNWGAAFIAIEGFPLLTELVSERFAFCWYLIFTLIGMIIMWIWMKETKDLSNVEIIKLFTLEDDDISKENDNNKTMDGNGSGDGSGSNGGSGGDSDGVGYSAKEEESGRLLDEEAVKV